MTPAFRRVLDELFAPVGRKVERIELSGGAGPALECDVAATASFALVGSSQEVTVDARAHLEIHDLGAYSRAGRPELPEWFRETVDAQVRREAFGRTLADLHRNAEACRRSLVETFDRSPGKLGSRARILADFQGLDLDLPKPSPAIIPSRSGRDKTRRISRFTPTGCCGWSTRAVTSMSDYRTSRTGSKPSSRKRSPRWPARRGPSCCCRRARFSNGSTTS